MSKPRVSFIQTTPFDLDEDFFIFDIDGTIISDPSSDPNKLGQVYARSRMIESVKNGMTFGYGPIFKPVPISMIPRGSMRDDEESFPEAFFDKCCPKNAVLFTGRSFEEAELINSCLDTSGYNHGSYGAVYYNPTSVADRGPHGSWVSKISSGDWKGEVLTSLIHNSKERRTFHVFDDDVFQLATMFEYLSSNVRTDSEEEYSTDSPAHNITFNLVVSDPDSVEKMFRLYRAYDEPLWLSMNRISTMLDNMVQKEEAIRNTVEEEQKEVEPCFAADGAYVPPNLEHELGHTLPSLQSRYMYGNFDGDWTRD